MISAKCRVMEFRLARGWRILYYILFVPLVGSFVCAMIYFLASSLDKWLIWLTVMPICLAAIGFFVYGLFEAIEGKYLLDSTGISYVSRFGEHRLMHHEVLGYRVDEQYLHIIPVNRERKKIKVSSYTERYSEIVSFIGSLHPNLHQTREQQEEEEILSRMEYGQTREERDIRLKSARSTTRIVNIGGSVIAAWAFLKPIPYELAVIAAIVMVVVPLPIVFIFKGLIRTNEEKGTAYPSVAIGVILPALAVCLRGLVDFEIEDYDSLVRTSIVGGVLLFAVYMVGTKEFPFSKWTEYLAAITVAVILSAYCYGASVFANCYYDRSPPVLYSATVTDKHISSGKNRKYYLKLSPWGRRTAPEDVSVSGEEYESYDVGAEITVSLRAGRLGVAWFYISE